MHGRPPRRPYCAQNDLQLHSIAHGVVLLEQLAIDYGAERRRIRVVKMRGISFQRRISRLHDRAGGLADLSAFGARRNITKNSIGEFSPSGNKELDMLLGGGLERGTNALLIGGAGVENPRSLSHTRSRRPREVNVDCLRVR